MRALSPLTSGALLAACVSFEHRSHLCNPLCSSLVTVTYWHRLAYWIVRNRLNGSYCADNRRCGNVKVEMIILLIPLGQNTPPILHFTLSWGSGFSGTWFAVLDFSAQCSHCSAVASLSLTQREKCCTLKIWLTCSIIGREHRVFGEEEDPRNT